MTTMLVPQDFLAVLRPHLPFADDGPLAESDDLAALGLDSAELVALLADIEHHYDVELPDDIVGRATFETVGSLWLALAPVIEGRA